MSSAFPLFLLLASNVFMTFAWYAHLKNQKNAPLWIAILTSWGIAFFEYCLQVSANRIGSQNLTLSQLKISQEIITMVVFGFFSVFYMNVPINRNYVYASICLCGAAYFLFRD